jgi:cytochrome c
MTRWSGIATAAAAAWFGVTLLPAGGGLAAQGTRSVWDGVYSEAQAARGKKLYIDACAVCHQEGLQGADLAPPLKGDDFVLRWDGQSIYDVVNTIRTTMPADAPGSLEAADTVEIVAYILQVNRIPAGRDDLVSDAAALRAIAMTKGPAR